MNHIVSVVQIKPVKNPNRIVANVDVRIDEMVIKYFKVVLNPDGTYWVSNPQITVGKDYINTLQFLDMDLDAHVKRVIKDAYLKSLQSPVAIPDDYHEDVSE